MILEISCKHPMKHLLDPNIFSFSFHCKVMWCYSFIDHILNWYYITWYGCIGSCFTNRTNYAPSQLSSECIIGTIIFAGDDFQWFQCLGTIATNRRTNTDIFSLNDFISNSLQMFPVFDLIWCWYTLIFPAVWYWKVNLYIFPNWTCYLQITNGLSLLTFFPI